jgi:hypothetical protein
MDKLEPEQSRTKLIALRVAYFLLGFWCGVIAILVVLIGLTAVYGL